MSTTLTPPPVAGTPAPVPPAPPRRESARVVSILAIVLGGALIAGTVVGGALAAVRMAGGGVQTLTASADRIAELDVDIAAGALTIAYDDVAEATLVVEGDSADDWRLTRDGDALSVTTQRTWWLGWGSLFGDRGGDQALLTLPHALRDTPLDADLQLGAGEIVAEGAYGSLAIEIGAGLVSVVGTADALDASVSAGRLRVDLDDVRTAGIEVSAGLADGRLGGAQPDAVTLEVSAGRVDLTLPDGRYAVASDVSAGDFSHTLTADATASSRIQVSVSAGEVTLRGAR